MDLLRGEAAVLLAEELDDEPARAAAPAARLPKPGERACRSSAIVIMIPVLKDVLPSRDAALHLLRPARALRSPAAADREDVALEPTRSIVASFYPLAWAAEQVAGGSHEVVNLTPAGAEPHDVELSPQRRRDVRDAELVVYVGGGFQPALEDAVGRGTAARSTCVGARRAIRTSGSIRCASPAPSSGSRERSAAGSAPPRLRRAEELDAEYRRGLGRLRRADVIVTTHAAFGHLARATG